MPAAEQGKLLDDWNATCRSFPDEKTLHALFSEQAARTPQAVAVTDRQAALTYAELESRSDALAQILARAGIGPGALVGLAVERSAQMAVALLGILKSGAAYLPLDPSYPADRIRFMIEDSRAALLLSERSVVGALPDIPLRRMLIDELDPAPVRAPPGPRCTTDDLAYVIYTSGSTGRPKGVEIAHRGVVNLITAICRELGFSSADRVLAVTSISFDISVLELFLPLLFGASLIVASRAEAADGKLLLARLQGSRASLMQATPVTWRLLIRAGWQQSAGLKLLCGGEAIEPELARQLLARTGGCFWNVYGPTETTIWSTAHKVTEADGSRIPIGRPLANTRLYIMSADGRLLPIGAIGELYIAGAGVARGYLGRPELTAERFLADPFAPGRMYRTGDLARYRPDGTVEFLGRVDQQVKIRGFRVELGEVEAVLREFAGVREIVVAAQPDAAGISDLVAFVVAGDAPPNATDLKEFARTRLPEYMVPSRIVPILALPTTPNGKIDRKRLLSRVPQILQSAEGHGQPRDAVEAKLVEIFELVLAVRPIGIDDGFFQLGGHSLRAVYLVDLIERHFGKRLHMNTLYHRGSSVAYLAAILRDPTAREPLPYLVPLGVQVTAAVDRPIFCMHTLVEGTLFFYEALAMRLGRRQPLFGVLPRGIEDGLAAHNSIEDMAAHCVAVMRARQPQGPYRLLGFSSAGMVAFEAARQLRQSGAEIELVALLDAYCPIGRRTLRFHREIFEDRFARAREMVAARIETRAAPRADAEGAAFRAMRWRHRWALRAYKPAFYPGRLTLVVAQETRPLFHEKFFGWERLAGEIDCQILPGGHYDFINEPDVGGLAEALSQRLDPVLPLPAVAEAGCTPDEGARSGN